MSDVFISYKRENLAVVRRLVDALRAEGVSVWWDQDIPPNAPWEATIEAELAAARLVVVAWSPAAVASDNVKAEARWARGQGRLLQVFVEASEPPLFFGERQGVDLEGWSGAATDPAFRTLLQAVRAEAASKVSAASSIAEPAQLTLPDRPSIAVMPFVNLSGDPGQDYFADGMVLEIVEALSRVSALFVIASSSTLALKGQGVSARDAGERFGVRYVLEGSVRRSGGRVRIGVQLIEAASASSIWTHRFEDTLEDVFDLQDKVALAVAGKIEPTLQQAETRRAEKRPTENMGSYDLYLRALPLMIAASRRDLAEALDLLNRSAAMDPDYGAALVAAALCHFMSLGFGWSQDVATDARRASELAERALRVAPDDVTVLTDAAVVKGYLDGDASAARQLIDRALGLNPGSVHAWAVSSGLRVDPEISLDHVARSLRLDPSGPNRAEQMRSRGNALLLLGRYAEALPCARELVRFAPENPSSYILLMVVLAHLGEMGEAVAAARRFQALTPLSPAEFMAEWARSPEVLAAGKPFFEGAALIEAAQRASLAL